MTGGYLQGVLYLMNRPEPIRQSGLLMVLATGLDDATSLIHNLQALAMESRPPWSNRILQLRLLLEQGRTLSEALSTMDGLLPDPTVVAIRVGEETGTLKQVLAEEAHRLMNSPANTSPVHSSLSATAAWVLGICIIASAILSYLMIKIVPKLERIFDDFGIELPAETMNLIGMSDYLETYWFLLMLPLVTFLALPVWQLWKTNTAWVSRGRVLYSEHFPRYWTPLILRMLSISVTAGTTLNDGIHAILKELTPGRAAEKLSAVRLRMSAGYDCWDSMQNNGFLKPREAAFLASAAKSKHLEWGLQHLARSLERRRGAWLQRIVGLVQPGIVLAIGLVVGYVVVALFVPLIKLINDLS